MNYGMGQYIAYQGCGIQSVLPETMEQVAQMAAQLQAQQLAARQAVGLGCMGIPCPGLGDYLQGFSFAVPQSLAPGNTRGLGSFTMDGTGLLGTGLFSGGLDLSTWGAGEWITILAGVWVLYSVFHTTAGAARYAAGAPGRRRQKKAAALRLEAATLSKKR
jgi:hypothetical protein